MITSIIFSKDRPAQLALMLESARRNLPDFFDLCVLYTGSTSEYQDGYDKLVHELDDSRQVSFVKQSDFKLDLESLLSDDRELACMFTDDDIVYRKCDFTLKECVDLMSELPLCCLSLRLGYNTIIQDPYAGTYTAIPRDMPNIDYFEREKAYIWNWSHVPEYLNFGYPMSVDGHIFSRDEILKIISSLDYTNPNQLEAGMTMHKGSMPPAMVCFHESKVVNTPINLVGSSENKAGHIFGQSLEEMNNKFLDGYHIDMDKMDFSSVVGCHQEIELKWTNGTE